MEKIEYTQIYIGNYRNNTIESYSLVHSDSSFLFQRQISQILKYPQEVRFCGFEKLGISAGVCWWKDLTYHPLKHFFVRNIGL